jgi:hypothetical protein
MHHAKCKCVKTTVLRKASVPGAAEEKLSFETLLMADAVKLIIEYLSQLLHGVCVGSNQLLRSCSTTASWLLMKEPPSRIK